MRLPPDRRPPPPLLASAFRPLFLAAGAFALVAIALWAGALARGAPALGPAWHGHELLFGYGGAVVAGFVLTAAVRWTGRATLRGAALAALLLLWTAARVAAALPAVPAGADAALGGGFFVLTAFGAGRAIVAARSRRNYGVVAILAAFAALDLAFWLIPAARSRVLLATLLAMLALIAVIGGRILPLFTANAVPGLRVRPAGQLRDRLALAALALLAVLVLVPPAPTRLVGAVAAVAALAHALRLWGWGGARTGRRPLLAVLHAAYACLPAGLALLAARRLGAPLPPWVALHVLAVGAFGLMTLGMMTRVALGHTGRVLRADRATAAAYALLAAAALARAAAPFAGAGTGRALLLASAALWCAAFALFLGAYAPRLLAPRVDGRPG